MINFDIHIGKSSVDSIVKVNGEDITSCIQHVTVDCGGGKLTQVRLKAVPFKVAPFDLSGPFMSVPRCDGCVWWERDEHPDTRFASCAEPSGSLKAGDDGLVWTRPDFGCVLFRPKAVVPEYPKSPDGTHEFIDVTTHCDATPRRICAHCQEPA